jgi:hypothetical protein
MNVLKRIAGFIYLTFLFTTLLSFIGMLVSLIYNIFK